jgi:hypothetical protein
MQTLQLPSNFTLGKNQINALKIRSMYFSDLLKLTRELELGVRLENFDRHLHSDRFRREAQVTGVTVDGLDVKLKATELLSLPIPLYQKLKIMLDDDKTVDATIVQNGNGIETPIVIKLGTPLVMKNKEGESLSINELEFKASTAMDLERILAQTSEVEQTWALLEDCCTPLGEDLSLMKLPSWAVEQITFGDGQFVRTQVLPNFLLLPQESSTQ